MSYSLDAIINNRSSNLKCLYNIDSDCQPNILSTVGSLGAPTGYLNNINNCDQGVEYYQRVGRAIYQSSVYLQVRFSVANEVMFPISSINNPDSPGTFHIRTVLLRDTAPNGASIPSMDTVFSIRSPNGVLQNNAGLSTLYPINPDYRSRFIPIYDHVSTLRMTADDLGIGPSGARNICWSIHESSGDIEENIPLDFFTTYSGTGSGINNVTSNSLRLFIFGTFSFQDNSGSWHTEPWYTGIGYSTMLRISFSSYVRFNDA